MKPPKSFYMKYYTPLLPILYTIKKKLCGSTQPDPQSGYYNEPTTLSLDSLTSFLIGTNPGHIDHDLCKRNVLSTCIIMHILQLQIEIRLNHICKLQTMTSTNYVMLGKLSMQLELQPQTILLEKQVQNLLFHFCLAI